MTRLSASNFPRRQTIHISAERYSYRYTSNLEPIATIDSGGRFTVETLDASTNTTRVDGDVTPIPIDRVNPATGPILIAGSRRGDSLAVHIRRIKLNELVHIKRAEGLGVCAESLTAPITRVFKIRDRAVVFRPGIRIPVRPMVGVIATAPSGEDLGTVFGGDFGGNMDNKLISEGSTVYLPVFCDGAHLFVGDLHASMGDGELCGLALEASGEVELEVELLSRARVRWPMGETGDKIFVSGYFPSPTEAIEMVSCRFAELMESRFGMSFEEGTLLLSAAGDLRLSQCAPNCGGVSARIEIEKKLLGMKKGESLF